jgi:hypothetical protein
MKSAVVDDYNNDETSRGDLPPRQFIAAGGRE